MASSIERGSIPEVLAGLLEECRRGAGHVVLVKGAVGTGKTHILHSFAGSAIASGAALLTASCARAEQGIEFGVVDQLFHGFELTEATYDQITKLSFAPGSAAAASYPRHTSGRIDAGVAQDLCGAVLALAKDRTVVISVDDVQFADDHSAQALLSIVRRTRFARVLVLLSVWDRPRSTRSWFDAELGRQPHLSSIALSRLSPAEVRCFVKRRGTGDEMQDAAAEWHLLTGGNPFLLQGLLDDQHQGPTTTIGGGSFCQAVISCLLRWDERILRVAQGLAVLGESAAFEVLAELIEMNTDSTVESVELIEAAGLLSGGSFRHPQVTAILLKSLGSRQRSSLSVRAAELLWRRGRDLRAVAALLLEADQPGGPWAVTVLREMASHASTADELAVAVRCLRLACRSDCEEYDRYDLMSQLARLEWRRDPLDAADYLAPLGQALSRGLLSERNAVTVVKHLLWHGRWEEAAKAYAELTSQSGTVAAGTDLEIAYHWLTHLYPLVSQYPPPTPNRDPLEAISDTWLRITTTLLGTLRDGRTAEVVAGAEYVLESRQLDDDTLEAVVSALFALISVDEIEKATYWCERLNQDVASTGASTWQALIGVIQSRILLRCGEPVQAAERACDAFALVSHESWGLAVGLPVSVLVAATTAMGDHDRAAKLVQLRVPATVFKTSGGIDYLLARGRHRLATGHLHAGLDDLRHCGELMAKWDLDLPSIAAWRAEAAEALARVGRFDEAKTLLREHFKLPTVDTPRAQGISLRALAAVGPPEQRVALLRESVELLQQCRDPLQLAISSNELDAALERLKDEDSATSAVYRTTDTVKKNHIPVRDRLRTQTALAQSAADGLKSRDRQHSTQIEYLTDAELRVAVLAARGHINREIAEKLYITVSTVEQHLTRIYRKLSVRRRGDLPIELRARAFNC